MPDTPRAAGKPHRPAAPKPRKIGRPSKFSPAVLTAFCDRIASGMSLRKAAAALGIAPETFCRWANRYPDFRVGYLEACQIRTTWLVEEMFAIARDGSGDYARDEKGQIIEGAKPNRENILRSKLRVQTIQWSIARMDPKQWGNRQRINATSDRSQLTVEERERRALELLGMVES